MTTGVVDRNLLVEVLLLFRFLGEIYGRGVC